MQPPKKKIPVPVYDLPKFPPIPPKKGEVNKPIKAYWLAKY